MNPTEELQLLLRETKTDILMAYRSLEFIKLIMDHNETINNSRHKHMFFVIYNMAITTIHIFVRRIYDCHYDRYPQRSIPKILNYLKEHTSDILIMDRSKFNIGLYNDDGFPKNDKSSPTLKSKFKAIKNFCNEIVAHNQSSIITSSEYGYLRDLVDHAQELVLCIERAYFGEGEVFQLDGGNKDLRNTFEDLMGKISE